MTGGWFKRGSDIKEDDFKSSSQLNRNLPEFWLNEGKDNGRSILFIDDPDFFCVRMTLKVRGEFVNFTSPGEEDPAWAQGYRGTPCLAFTVFDLTPFKDKKGNDRKYSKKLFLARGKATKEILQERRENSGGNLVGLKMKIMRLGEKASRSGTDFQVLGRVDFKKMNIPPEDLKPFDYMEMLAPPTVKQIEAVLKYAAPPMGRKSKTVSRESLNDIDPFVTDAANGSFDSGDKGPPGVADFGHEPKFENADEIPF